jgi:hypothetical protein
MRSQEYQLIEDFDPAVYRRFNNTSEPQSAGLPPPLKATSIAKKAPNILLGTGPMLKRMDSVHGRSREMRNFFILSMGHRIQFMQYDDAGVSACGTVAVWVLAVRKVRWTLILTVVFSL